MKPRLTVILVYLSCSLGACGQEPLSIRNYEFKGIFGTSLKDSTRIYSLLGTGFFLAPSSNDMDDVIENWILRHPNAIVKPVYTQGPIVTDDPDSRQTYCWIIDENENLNIHLIQLGCTSGTNMRYPTKEVKKELGWDKLDLDLFEEVHVSELEYSNFMDLAQKATNEAFEKKLGIWKDKKVGNNR